MFETLSRFQAADRLFMILGNHDKAKEKKTFALLTAGSRLRIISLIIAAQRGERLMSDPWAPGRYIERPALALARWMVRYLWKPLLNLGFKDPSLKL